MLSSEEASKLLDFSQKLDISLLDRIVECLYTSQGDQLRLAQDILTTLKEHPDAWTRVDSILEFSQNQQTKFYALQILEEVIKTRWKILPRNQCEGIKKYVVGLIIKTSSDAATMEANKVYLNKLNIILVQILKREWPRNWETFISDIVGASKTNESLCKNNMVILKNLSEEVFDFSSGQITQTKAKHLKDTMCSEFSQVFQLCSFVLESSMNAPLIQVTLETLLRFLNWIPLGYIFETSLIDTLIFKFLSVPMFRNVTLKCLSEIAGLTVPDYNENFINLFKETMTQLNLMISTNTNMNHIYANGNDTEQIFVQNLAMFLCTFLKEHGKLVEDVKYIDFLNQALLYLVMISEVEDVEVFKICLEYWNSLVEDLYSSESFGGNASVHLGQSDAVSLAKRNAAFPRRRFYSSILSKVRYIMISRMAKPEEVLVVENENGEVVREFMKDTNAINLYKNMRETLVFLTHLDYADTERIMTLKLLNQRCKVPSAREPKVLNAMATIVHKLRNHITNEVPKVFDAVFECTLDMINKNFEDYPQHRISFYELLQAVNAHCFKAFLNIPPAQFKLVFDSVVWAFKHTMRNVADIGLNILFKMLQNLTQHPQAAQSFYQTYFTDILMQIFSVVTDTSHTAGLGNHAIILAYMFSLVENNKITVNLGPIPDNTIFIQEYVASLLKSAFSHLTDNQIKVFVTGLFNLDENVQAFKEHLRDFLIQIREVTGEDDSDLYLEEREAALREEQANKLLTQRAFCEEDEKRFLVTVIKDLLGLCEQKKGKDNKAIIASNIMYVVGQYPRFLRAHWKFLKTVVNKLFEFMHETHDGVQDMACDTFIKIAIKCRRYFVTIQPNEACTFIDEILSTMSTIICDLQPQQVHTFYEAVGYMISAQMDQVQQDALIEKYMFLPNQVWDEIISRASKNVDFLKNMTAVKQLGSILKTNVAACKALGHAYVIQLGRIYLDMLNVYKITSENIIQAIELNGVNVNNQPLIKAMHVVKKETLNLISEWVSRSNDNQLVMDNFIPPLLDAILLDYQENNK
uniref:Exportin-1 n=1 Tax=Glossina austeni TaxID=7395 RepID=A0A1A9URN0_GLOAU